MRLSGRQLEEIQRALLDVYQSPDALRMLVHFELDENLNELAGGENLRVLVFNLLTWAQQQERVLDLLDGACNQTPGSQALAEVRAKARTWLGVADAGAASQATPYAPVQTGPSSIDIFLCYSHQDMQATRQVQDILRGAGLSVWVDEALKAGTPDWVDAIEDAIHQAQAMVVLLSPNARASKGVKDEVNYALLKRKHIFSVLLTGDAADVVPMSLSSMQWVDGRGRLHACVEKELLPAVLSHLGRPVAQPPPRQAPTQAIPSTPSPQPATQQPKAKVVPPVAQATPSSSGDSVAVASSKGSDIAVRIGIEWVTIPAGEFTMGSNDHDDEKPIHKVRLLEYRIAKYPVTNVQYQAFVQATSHKAPQHWDGGKIPQGKENHPVVNVTWYDAMAFCQWAGVCLPTEAQWEKAARGTDGRKYPWGNNEPTKDLCNFDGNVRGTTPVGKYPKGASPYGLLDMAGNVWEWTSSLYYPYPYDASDGRESAEGTERRVLRGGAYVIRAAGVRCGVRFRDDPLDWYWGIGFRVVASPSTSGL